MTLTDWINTFTREFNEILDEVEDMFGKRDQTFTFIGPEVRSNGPYNWHYPNNRISIVLGPGSVDPIQYIPQLQFQLSHEVCHLLTPIPNSEANVLEEGIATYYSIYYMDKKLPGHDYGIISYSSQPAYLRAYKLVSKLLKSDPQAIKKIRAINPIISTLTKEELKSLNFDIEESDIDSLVATFVRI